MLADVVAVLVVSGDERDGDLVLFSSFDSSSKMSNKFSIKLSYFQLSYFNGVFSTYTSRFTFSFPFLSSFPLSVNIGNFRF